jgi:predicted amidophosphoribosyltransferase
MYNFKHKNLKKIVICKKKNTTLDAKHKELTDKFRHELTEILPKLEREQLELQNKLNDNAISLPIEIRLDLIDTLKNIKLKIKNIKINKKEYMLSNSQYIFEYFENKKNINNGEKIATVLDDFFNIKNDDLNEVSIKERTNVQKYLSNIDESFLNIENFVMQTDICNSCNKGEMIPIEHEGILVCNACSKSIHYLVENEKSSYKDPPKEVCFYAYKRINHFREILAQFQAKETTQIPEEVLENIKQQIKKERINVNQITDKRAKEILKKLGYNKFYEHIPFIKDKLGIKPPIMSSDLEDTLCNLFMDIQGPYAKYCPDDRVNFLNYYYTVYKLCELLNQRQFLPYFPMLKDREKRIEQDEIWRKICDELDWEYIPTI